MITLHRSQQGACIAVIDFPPCQAVAAPISPQKADCILYGLHYQGSRAEMPPIECNGLIMERELLGLETLKPASVVSLELWHLAEATSRSANGKVSGAFRLGCFNSKHPNEKRLSPHFSCLFMMKSKSKWEQWLLELNC